MNFFPTLEQIRVGFLTKEIKQVFKTLTLTSRGEALRIAWNEMEIEIAFAMQAEQTLHA